MVLFTNEIQDYDLLRKDYEDYCRDCDIEPQPDGEYEWFDDETSMDYHDFKGLLKEFDNRHPDNWMLCTGRVYNRYFGQSDAGAVFHRLSGLVRYLVNCYDYITISLNDDGIIEVSGSHHDASVRYTVTMLNRRATKKLENLDKESILADRELNDSLDRKYYFKKFLPSDFCY